ncbi:vitamin K epoxide reductase family protein [Rhodococcus zopfii]|uniref:vitamin K epoxide reductase family protein n=1 Tax=Rhodococcus zopfii TaxID=43772 RepID=UPI0009353ED0|nr:vitamin K epoxide reductase family protein [Rhodococcus zopfii]
MRSTPHSTDAVNPPSGAARGGAPFGRALSWLLLVGGLVGLGASFVLTVEKFTLAANPDYIPTCSLNPVLNCGSIMSTPQAAVFGFPNSLLGIAGFSVVAATGAALLAGARLARWYWLSLQVGVTAAAAFVHWLIIQSLYEIGALCPYCMIVWAVTVPVFWYVTLRNITYGAFIVRPRSAEQVSAAGLHLLPITVWFLIVAALVIHRFFSYWSGLI